MIGVQVADTDGVARAILENRFDLAGYDAFVERHLAASDGAASARFVERFMPAIPGGVDAAERAAVRDTLPAHVHHE